MGGVFLFHWYKQPGGEGGIRLEIFFHRRESNGMHLMQIRRQ